MKKIIAVALLSIGISPDSAVASEAELSGSWNLTFFTAPEPLEIAMSFLEVTVFFVGVSGSPHNCTWFGVDLPLGGQSSIVTGVMTCGVPTPTLGAFLFATATNNDMTGVMIAPELLPPVAEFEGQRVRSLAGPFSRR